MVTSYRKSDYLQRGKGFAVGMRSPGKKTDVNTSTSESRVFELMVSQGTQQGLIPGLDEEAIQ